MDLAWGSPVGSGTQFRVGIASVVPTPTSGDATVTLTWNIWVWTKTKVSDSSVDLSLSGTGLDAWSGTISISTPSTSNWSTKNQKLVKTVTKVVPTAYGPLTYDATASMTGIGAAGTATVGGYTSTVTLPARPYTAPAAPVGCLVTATDGAMLVNWTNTLPTSEGSPYQLVELWRWDNATNAWYLIVTLGAVTSFTDATVQGDRRYQYRVRAGNSGGMSDWATSATIETAPTTPTGVTATRQVVNVDIAWQLDSSIASSIKVWHLANGVLDAAPLATLAGTARTYTHVAPAATVTHSYKIQALGVLAGALSEASAVVPALAAPQQALGVSPGGISLDSASSITFLFQHRPVDGTSQTAFKLRYREQGTATWNHLTGATVSGSASTSTSRITAAGHSLNLGHPVSFSGTLPSPLVADTVYFAVPTSESQFAVATSEENALAGTTVTLTTAPGAFTVQTYRQISPTGTATLAAASLAYGKSWEWQVATQGKYVGLNPFSPWSDEQAFRTCYRPLVTISYPIGNTDSPTAMVAWTMYSAEGATQQWWQVALYDADDNQLEIYEGTGEWTTVSFATDLINGATYSIDVLVEDSNGIRSDVSTATFTPDFIGPIAPGMGLEWDGQNGWVVISITNNDDEEAPVVVSNTLQRSVAGGAFETVRENIPPNTTLVDFLPHPNKVNTYRVIAKTAEGTNEVSTASVSCDNTGDWYWLNGGPGFSTLAKVRYGAGTTVRFAADKTLHRFAGRTRPVQFSGTQRTREIDLSAILPRDAEGWATKAEILALEDTGTTVYYRDPQGERLLCSLGEVQFEDGDSTIAFRVTLTEVSA